MKVQSLPFRIIALAPLLPQQKVAWTLPAVPVERDGMDRAVEACGLSLSVAVPSDLRADGRLAVRIRRYKDFHPDGLLASQPDLAALADIRDFARDATARGLSAEAVRDRLRAVPGFTFAIPEPPARAPSRKTAIDDILNIVALPDESPAPDTETRGVAAWIETVLQNLLRHIVADTDFRSAEAAWRGVNTVLRQGIGDADTSFEVVPTTPDTLEETLAHLTLSRADDLPSLVLVDVPFDATARGVELLEKVALFAETLLVPTVCWGAPGVLGLASWEDLSKLAYLPHVLDEPAFAKWRRLQGLPSARWVAVTCNRFLVRAPYGPDNKPSTVRFDEPEGLFASPVWAVGALIAKSARVHGWPTRFTEWGTIRLENLPLREIERGRRIPTETAIGEDRLMQFAKAGFTPLASALDKDIVFSPVEATMGRGSLRYQLLLSWVVRLLIWCRENLPADPGGASTEESVRNAFAEWWERTGQPAPSGLQVTAVPAAGERKGALRLVLDPSREVLPTAERIELEFPW